MKLGRWEILKHEIEGYELFAPSSFWNTSQEEIKEKTGGCGPGEIGDWFVPDSLYGESIFLACQIHDFMYGEGKNIEDKKWADIIFLINMTLLIISSKGKLDILRLKLVMDYFEAVYFGGKEAFKKGKTPNKEEV